MLYGIRKLKKFEFFRQTKKIYKKFEFFRQTNEKSKKDLKNLNCSAKPTKNVKKFLKI